MSGLKITVTHAGYAALVNAENTGTNAVRVSQIGLTDQDFTPAPELTELPGEHRRLATFSGSAVADDTVHVTIRDESSDSYSVRGFALYLEDGTLLAVHGQPDIILEKATQAMLLLAADIRFTDVAATTLEFGDTNWTNPPATTEAVGVVELATAAEAVAGTDSTRAMTPASHKAATDARLGAGAPSSFMKTLLSAATAAAVRLALELGNAARRDEGAGNGLDADKLDGQHGSYYRAWGNLTGVPSAFNPDEHDHSWGDIKDVPGTATRWPQWNEVTGKPSAFNPTTHAHAWGDIAGKPAQATRWPSWGEVASKPSLFPSDVDKVDGLSAVLGTKVDLLPGVHSVPDSDGNGEWRVAMAGSGNDNRIRLQSGSSFSFGAGAILELNGANALVSGFGVRLATNNGIMLLSAPDVRLVADNVSINGHDVYHGGNLDPVLTSGSQRVGGIKTWTSEQRFEGGWGRLRIVLPSFTGRTAWIGFFNNDDSRCGYIGYADDNNIEYFADGGRRHNFNTGISTAGSVEAVGHIRSENIMQAASFRSISGSGDLSAESAGAGIRLMPNGYTTEGMLHVLGNGNVTVSGTLTPAGGYDFGSSIKLKHVDGKLPYGLAEVERMQTAVGRYREEYNADGRRRLFFIAEQLAELIPEAVDLEGVEFEGERVASVKLEQILPVFANAISELSAEVKQLRMQVIGVPGIR